MIEPEIQWAFSDWEVAESSETKIVVKRQFSHFLLDDGDLVTPLPKVNIKPTDEQLANILSREVAAARKDNPKAPMAALDKRITSLRTSALNNGGKHE